VVLFNIKFKIHPHSATNEAKFLSYRCKIIFCVSQFSLRTISWYLDLRVTFTKTCLVQCLTQSSPLIVLL